MLLPLESLPGIFSVHADEHESISYRTWGPGGKFLFPRSARTLPINSHGIGRFFTSKRPFASDLCILESLWIWKGTQKLKEYLTSTDTILLCSYQQYLYPHIFYPFRSWNIILCKQMTGAFASFSVYFIFFILHLLLHSILFVSL